MRVISRRTWATIVVVVMVAACSAETVDKAGGDTVVLQLASIDGVNSNGQSFGVQEFVEALGEVSAGRLQVEVNDTYGDGAADAESSLVAGIASGEIDGGWPSTRAFSEAGIAGLEAVEAPMTITSYEAQKALVSDPAAEEMLQSLDGSGVIGLGLSVGPLRRPFSKTPLLDPEDWAGARFRVFNSPVQTDAIRALGAEPVNVGFEWREQILAGELQGAEFDIAQYQANGYTTEVGNVTSNVVLWPKMFVLSISEARFETLTEEQQTWVREAAERGVQASVEADYDETTPAMELCESGMRFLEATPQQVTGLSDMLAPVIDQMAGDPDIGPSLARIQEVATGERGHLRAGGRRGMLADDDGGRSAAGNTPRRGGRDSRRALPGRGVRGGCHGGRAQQRVGLVWRLVSADRRRDLRSELPTIGSSRQGLRKHHVRRRGHLRLGARRRLRAGRRRRRLLRLRRGSSFGAERLRAALLPGPDLLPDLGDGRRRDHLQ